MPNAAPVVASLDDIYQQQAARETAQQALEDADQLASGLEILRIAKKVILREKRKGKASQDVEVRLDAFNLLNHVNYINYVGTLTSPYFGRANDAHLPRQIQLSVRVGF